MAKGKFVAGKVVIVTGAGRGVGRAIALLMAEHGAKVVVNDVGASLSGEGQDLAPAEEVAALIREGGGEAVVSTDSVAEPESAEKIVTTALEAFGNVHCVVNNAGILRDRIFHQMSYDDWDSVIRVHLMGSFYVSRAAAPHFRQQEHGCFIHMTSASGMIGNIGQANYSAAKLGLIALSKSIALDMQRYNVRSNCISPFAWGRMTSSIPTDTPEQQDKVEKLKRMSPEKNAPLAVFLASDAAKDVTGQIFGPRNNEIFLFSQPRPIRSIHRSEGWTPETIAEHAMPALQPHFHKLDINADIFSWDPV